MRKYIQFTLLVFLLTALAGCLAVSGADEDTPPEMTGLIFDIDGGRILVVAGIEDANISYDTWFEAGNRAAWFAVTGDTVIKRGGKTVSADQLEKGMKVQVWAVGPMAESYPEQGEAKKIVIVEQ
jgi:hypothetical protein